MGGRGWIQTLSHSGIWTHRYHVLSKTLLPIAAVYFESMGGRGKWSPASVFHVALLRTLRQALLEPPGGGPAIQACSDALHILGCILLPIFPLWDPESKLPKGSLYPTVPSRCPINA